jgi:hypothetical protein
MKQRVNEILKYKDVGKVDNNFRFEEATILINIPRNRPPDIMEIIYCIHAYIKDTLH